MLQEHEIHGGNVGGIGQGASSLTGREEISRELRRARGVLKCGSLLRLKEKREVFGALNSD